MWFIVVNISANCTSMWFFPLGCYIRSSRVAFGTIKKKLLIGAKPRTKWITPHAKAQRIYQCHFLGSSLVCLRLQVHFERCALTIYLPLANLTFSVFPKFKCQGRTTLMPNLPQFNLGCNLI